MPSSIIILLASLKEERKKVRRLVNWRTIDHLKNVLSYQVMALPIFKILHNAKKEQLKLPRNLYFLKAPDYNFKLLLCIWHNDLFKAAYPSHALPYNWKHHQNQNYFSIHRPNSSQKEDEYFILKNSFFFLTSFVNGTFILPAYSTITEGEKDCFLVGFVGKEDSILSMWNSDKEQLVDKEGPMSTKKYLSK